MARWSMEIDRLAFTPAAFFLTEKTPYGTCGLLYFTFQDSYIMPSSDIPPTDIISLLTNDVQNHREYIQKLYRNALFLVGGVLIGGIFFLTWVLGNRLDDSILNHQIDSNLKEKVEQIVRNNSTAFENKAKEAVEKAKTDIQNTATEAAKTATDAAQETVDQYAKDTLANEVEKKIKPALEKLAKASATELATKIQLPSGLVAAFDRSNGCPEGWEDMAAEWEGRTIVVAGTTFAFGATGGERRHKLTVAEMPAHNHFAFVEGEGTQKLNSANAVGRWGRQSPNEYNYTLEGYPGANPTIGRTSTKGKGAAHNNMPPYVALLYCRKE